MPIYNFSAGPSALSASVKERAYKEFNSYLNKGFHIAEISHRSADYEQINSYVHAALLRLYGLDAKDYSVCLGTGGATMQMSLLGLNFAPNSEIGLIDTDIWTKKAASELSAAGKRVHVLASSKDENYSHIPTVQDVQPGEFDFVYICSNNTVAGTQYASVPNNLGDLVVDASSDFLARELDFSNIAVIYAGAQKNAGIAGVAPLIIRNDFLERSKSAALASGSLPEMMRYSTHVAAASMFNTPPTWSVYILSLVLQWLEDQGGLSAISQHNERQASALYGYIDSSDFYRALVAQDRSLMNVCFATPNAELDAKFVASANEHGLIGLKGHRAKGGLRASIYNACSDEALDALIAFMQEFARCNG